jgi:hypothetical protein
LKIFEMIANINELVVQIWSIKSFRFLGVIK